VAYGDGSVTAGDFTIETLTFAGCARVARIALRCGHDNEGISKFLCKKNLYTVLSPIKNNYQ
jgi:hypothetical protein